MKRLFVLPLAILLVLGSLICFASCDRDTVRVQFVVDGEVYARVSAKGGESVQLPADPTKSGYTFDGWYYDEGEDYAKWQMLIKNFEPDFGLTFMFPNFHETVPILAGLGVRKVELNP